MAFDKDALKPNIEALVRHQKHQPEFTLPDASITDSEKLIDQQGRGENDWDCGPIVFSNVVDYIRAGNQALNEVRYQIPIYNAPGHDEQIRCARNLDAAIYNDGITNSDDERINEIKVQLAKDTQSCQAKTVLLSEIGTDLNPAQICQLFQILENKRLFEGGTTESEYTVGELDYARGVLLEEVHGSGSSKTKVHGKRHEDASASKHTQRGDASQGSGTQASTKQAQEEKLKGDISRLIDIRDILVNEENFHENTIIQTTVNVTQLLNEISWNQDDKFCIRNVHGYKNRSKSAGNKKNTEGAKLDFETLGRIPELVKSDGFEVCLNKNHKLLCCSLKILKAKVGFILANKKEELTGEYQEKIKQDATVEINHEYQKDEGFLTVIAAFYHDLGCINKLIELLETIEKHNHDLNLTQKIDRYCLGYIFCLMGETAKELSDYLRYEGEEEQESLIGKLFKQIGKYRQEIKDHPNVIYNLTSNRLSKMLDSIQKVKSELVTKFKLLRNFLEDIKSLEGEELSIQYQELSRYQKENLEVVPSSWTV